MIPDIQKDFRDEILKIMHEMPCTYTYLAVQADLAPMTIKKLIDNKDLVSARSLRTIREFIRKYKEQHG